MSGRKYSNSQPRQEPQKCGLCKNPGHNRKCKDCPFKLFNAEKQRLIDFHGPELNQLLEIEQQLLNESSSSSGGPLGQNEFLHESSANNFNLPPQDARVVERMVADYQQRLDREAAELYKVSRESSFSMEVVTATEHRAITLSKPFYEQEDLNKSAARISTDPAVFPMDVVESSVNQQASGGLVAAAPPQTSVIPSPVDLNPFFVGGPFLPADDVDDVRHQLDQAVENLRLYKGFGPPPSSVAPVIHISSSGETGRPSTHSKQSTGRG
jgi:hypothetical protein